MTKSNDDTVTFIPDITDPLRLFRPQAPPVRIEFGALSHCGSVRPRNEDNYVVVRRSRARSVLMTSLREDSLPYSQDDAFVMIVADGMGGRAFGEVASSLALRTAWDSASQASSWIMKLNEDELPEIKDRAEACVQLLNRTLLEQAELNPDFAGMGTTLTCAYSMGADLVIIHVGDSRAYIVRGHEVRQITHDHTLAQDLKDSGLDSSDTIGFRHLLTNCLGGSGDVFAEVNFFRLEDGDQLLLCTDGLTDLVDDDEIGEVLSHETNAQTACQALVDRALGYGGKDNVTVVLARYEIPEQESDEALTGDVEDTHP
jgi:protein phosphatase